MFSNIRPSRTHGTLEPIYRGYTSEAHTGPYSPTPMPHQPIPVHTAPHQPIPVHTAPHQPIRAHTCPDRLTQVHTGPYSPTPAPHRPIPVHTDSHQPIPVHTSPYNHIPGHAADGTHHILITILQSMRTRWQRLYNSCPKSFTSRTVTMWAPLVINLNRRLPSG